MKTGCASRISDCDRTELVVTSRSPPQSYAAVFGSAVRTLPRKGEIAVGFIPSANIRQRVRLTTSIWREPHRRQMRPRQRSLRTR